jgi:hypothetical protein
MAVGGIVAAIGAVEAEGWLAKAWLAAMAVVVVVWFAMGGRPVAVGKR